MADGDTQRFHCPTCDKRYRWKPELAGRKVKCAGCGSKLRVPAAGGGAAELLEAPPPPKEEPPDLGDMYELDMPSGPASTAAVKADDGKCPNCNTQVKPGAVLCLNCGFNFAEGKVMQTVVGAGGGPPVEAAASAKPIGGALAMASMRKGVDNAALAEDAAKQHMMSNIYAPLILIGIGLVLVLINAFLLGPMTFSASPFSTNSTADAIAYSIFLLIYAGIRLVVQVPILLVGIFIVAAMFGNSYGTLGVAMLKLIAIALMVGATGDSIDLLLDYVTGGFGGIGWMIKFSVICAIFYAIAMPLLDMDILEALVLFGIMIFAPMIIMVFVVGLLMAMF